MIALYCNERCFSSVSVPSCRLMFYATLHVAARVREVLKMHIQSHICSNKFFMIVGTNIFKNWVLHDLYKKIEPPLFGKMGLYDHKIVFQGILPAILCYYSTRSCQYTITTQQ